jgi:hypothetical protein
MNALHDKIIDSSTFACRDAGTTPHRALLLERLKQHEIQEGTARDAKDDAGVQHNVML